MGFTIVGCELKLLEKQSLSAGDVSGGELLLGCLSSLGNYIGLAHG
jgi:hypothetical protein